MQSQAEFWNQAGGAAWVAGEAELDAQLAPYGRLALAAADLQPGHHVLDVGCGCGATTEALAELVGPTGRVLGVDVSAPMLGRARERVAARNVEFLLADAATAPLPEARFDRLFSRFGVMFFDDTVAAFAHLRETLRPGGRVAMVVWQSLDANEWVTVPAAAVADLVELPPLGAPDQPGPFRFGDRAFLASELEAAGFAGVELAPHDLEYVIGGGLTFDAAVDFTIDHGPLRRVLAGADADLRRTARERIAAALQSSATSNGVRLGSACWVVTAHRP